MPKIKTHKGCAKVFKTNKNKVTKIGNNAFDCTAIQAIDLPDSLQTIGNHAFENCTSLKSITIPSSVTSIGYNAFENCDMLALENYKSRTGYPWDATKILIHNEDVTTTINASNTDRQVPTAKAVYDFYHEN